MWGPDERYRLISRRLFEEIHLQCESAVRISFSIPNTIIFYLEFANGALQIKRDDSYRVALTRIVLKFRVWASEELQSLKFKLWRNLAKTGSLGEWF